MADKPAKRRMHHSKLRDYIDEAIPERKRPGRKPRPKSQPQETRQRKQTSYDADHMPLHCMNCGRIYNGPHFGEVMETGSPEYKRIDQEQRRLRGAESIGAISDTFSCNKRSCIDTYAKDHYDKMRHKYQDRDWTDVEQQFKQERYDFVRNNPEQFPEGFIDDVESPI